MGIRGGKAKGRAGQSNTQSDRRRFGRGGEVVLTDRGRPVGKIVPFQQKELSLSERIKDLEDRGTIAPEIGKKKPALFTPIPVPDNIAQKFLREDRDAGS